jgi:hypothetical protein
MAFVRGRIAVTMKESGSVVAKEGVDLVLTL